MIKKLLFAPLKLIGSRIEKGSLQDTTAGIGLAGSAFAHKLLEGELRLIQDTLSSRGANCVNISEAQATWLRLPLDINEVRPAYNLYSTEKFPEAQYYVIVSHDERKVYFNIYGASFFPLFEASSNIEEVLVLDNLKKYIRDCLCTQLAMAMRRFPEAFTPRLTYGPPRREISRIFTLPPLR